MAASKTRALHVLIIFAILAVFSHSAFGATSIRKSVTPIENGNYLIKLRVTTSGPELFGLRLVDPDASIVDVYAPRGWCALTDGGDYLARTGDRPVKSGRTVEFIIHSTTDSADYTWSVYGRMKQVGKPEKL